MLKPVRVCFGRKAAQSLKNITINSIKVNEFDPKMAIKVIKAESYRSFTESINILVQLGTDARRTEQNVRGTCVMPSGLGKNFRVAFFVGTDEEAKAAVEAGADQLGDEKLIKEIEAGKINFETLMATPKALAQLKPYARLLGKQGLFPNVKSGTLVNPENIGLLIRVRHQERQERNR